VTRTSRAERGLTALAAAALLAGTALVGSPASAKTADEILSNERTVSYWAVADTRTAIRSSPSEDAAAVATLRLTTELHAPEVYLALKRHVAEDGRRWLEVRVPDRPNGQVGWVPEDSLGALEVTYSSLTIDLRHRRARLFQSGSPVWSAPVGVGKRGTPTPRGHFYVRERLRLGRKGGPYGTFAFGTSAYSNRLTDWPGGGVIGIHGTNQPRLIPGSVSHGCVRLRNSDVGDLRRLMGLGTPVWIR
jgi:hypothetical protein